MKLYAPPLYWSLSPEGKADICNGCGAKGFGWTVPETIWGLKITEACNIHDFMYLVGVDEEDRQEADRVFFNNLIRIIEAKTKLWPLKMLRHRRALKYYEAVRCFGGPAFWAGKNEPETERDVA
jgi:hypothetical protein